MAENSSIQWTEHTFNPWIGCAKVHPGCIACYAEHLVATRFKRVEWGPGGTRVKTKTWDGPPRWQREAVAQERRFRVFCASLADVFEDRPELAEWRRELFHLIDRCPSLDWQLLTKRPNNIGRMWYTREQDGMSELTREEFRRHNVWIGTSISDQATANEYGKRLLVNRPFAQNLFLSMEPQIGPVDLVPLLETRAIDWVIVGGESKQGKHEPRLFDMHWLDKTLSDCAAYGIPAFVKQMGSNVVCGDRTITFKDKHGGNSNEWPQEYRVRQFPKSAES